MHTYNGFSSLPLFLPSPLPPTLPPSLLPLLPPYPPLSFPPPTLPPSILPDLFLALTVCMTLSVMSLECWTFNGPNTAPE